MKQKLTFIISAAFLLLNFSANTLALDLEGQLKKVAQNAGVDVAQPINIPGVDGKIEDAINSIKQETLGKVDEKVNEVSQKIDAEISKVTQKIEEEEQKIRAMIQEAEDGINKFRDIKAKAEKYINIAKAVLAFLSCSIVAIAFFLWRTWRNIVGFKRLIQNVTNYDEIKNRIDDLENELAQMDGKMVADEVLHDTAVKVKTAPPAPQKQATPMPPRKQQVAQQAPAAKPAPVEEDDLNLDDLDDLDNLDDK